jgi:hypothetical protein
MDQTIRALKADKPWWELGDQVLSEADIAANGPWTDTQLAHIYAWRAFVNDSLIDLAVALFYTQDLRVLNGHWQAADIPHRIDEVLEVIWKSLPDEAFQRFVGLEGVCWGSSFRTHTSVGCWLALTRSMITTSKSTGNLQESLRRYANTVIDDGPFYDTTLADLQALNERLVNRKPLQLRDFRLWWPALYAFVYVVCICDGLFELIPNPSPNATLRFFRIATQLPPELQRLICAKVHGPRDLDVPFDEVILRKALT